MNKPINILHLEDDPIDAKLVQSILKSANVDFEYYYADNENDYISFLKDREIDIILSDYNIPGYSGMDAMNHAKENYPNIPFVFISGVIGEDIAVGSLLNGATDFVLKNNMERLGSSVKRAFKEAQEQKARQKAENELRKLYWAVEQSHNIIIITDSNGIIEYINPSALTLTGYSSEELIGKTPNVFSSGEKSKKEYEQLWQTIKSGKEWKGEFHNKKKNGELYWESATISPILNENGEITHFVAIKEDITASKKLTMELIQAKEKAEESDRLKTAFLHNISHEIRTPMNAIVGFSGLLNDKRISQEKRDRYIDIVVKSSEQLLSIISDIVNIATIEAGQEKINERETDLNETLKIIYNKFLPKATDQDISLHWRHDLSEQNIKIITDEPKLIKILSILIENSLKFTEKGAINFGCKKTNNEIEFFVEDTGIGIPENMHEEIFKRFRQVEYTANRRFGGSGLGLSILKAYVELLGGRIWLKSELNVGTTFYFTLPC